MRLTLEQNVLDLVGQAQRVGNNSTIKTTLTLVTTQIENHLGTPLGRFDRVDYFGCPKNLNASANPSGDVVATQDPYYLLNLSAGFIDTDQTFEVYYSDDNGQILDPTNATNVELVDPVYYALDARLGRLTLFGSKPIPTAPFRTIAVVYTSGFEVDEHDVAQNVPQSIQNAAASMVGYDMRNHTTTATNRTPFKEFQNTHRRTVTGLLSSYIRPRATGDFPQFTEATEVVSGSP